MKTVAAACFSVSLLALAGTARAQYGDYGGYYVPPGSLSFGGDFSNPSYSAGYSYPGGLGYSNIYNSGYSSSFPAYGRPGYRRYGSPLYGPLPSTSLGRANSLNALNRGPYRSANQYPPGWHDADWLDAQLGRTSSGTARRPTMTGSAPLSLWSLGLGPGYVYPSYGYGSTGLSAGNYSHPGHPGRVLPMPN